MAKKLVSEAEERDPYHKRFGNERIRLLSAPFIWYKGNSGNNIVNPLASGEGIMYNIQYDSHVYPGFRMEVVLLCLYMITGAPSAGTALNCCAPFPTEIM